MSLKITFSDDAMGDGAAGWFLNLACRNRPTPVFDVTKVDGTKLEGMMLHSIGRNDDTFLFTPYDDQEELVMIDIEEIDTLTYC